MPSRHALTLALVVATAATAAASDNLLDPFPSLRSVGDTVYSKYSAVLTNITGNGTKAQVAAAASSSSHAVTDALHSAKSPAGNYTYAAFQAIDTLMYNKTQPGVCNPANKKKIEVFAIDGSGLLLPYYSGVIQALQDRGVLTPEVMATAKFGGLSGGAFTSIMTALGWPGTKQLQALKDTLAAIPACVQNAISAGKDPKSVCTLNQIALPQLLAKFPANAHKIISKRVTAWACLVNPMAKTIENSVAVGTSEWTSPEDIIDNMRVTSLLPCFSVPSFYALFRGAPYIDGGYCSDYAQLCAKSPDKCLKISTTFLGPQINGSPMPNESNCKAYVPPDYLPYPGKPYYVPSNRDEWTLPQGPCSDQALYDAVAAPGKFVAQGVTAKPDIHPAFYAPLPSKYATACQWLGQATNGTTTAADLDVVFQHGYASGIGWADANGYCA